MKNLFIILLAAIAVVGCKKDKNNGMLDPNAKIAINPAPGIKSRTDNPNHLSAKEIVEQATIMSWWNYKITGTNSIERGFNDAQRDVANCRLYMASTDVVDELGRLTLEFIEGEDYILEAWYNWEASNPNFYKDTIAYIPNVVIRAAETKIKAAYAAKDYAQCYKLMDEAFTYTPITGAEWRALKAEGKN